MGNQLSPLEGASQAQSRQIESQNGDSNVKAMGKTAEVRLPHNCEAILRDADSPIDMSSVDKLYEHLYAKVFLNQKRRMYWVEKDSNKNCFMLFARDLSITWSEDSRLWQWRYHNDSDVSFDAAELLNVCWLEIHGTMDTTMLSPGTLYEVAFIIMIKDPAYGWEVPVSIRLTLPNGNKQEHTENLMYKPRWQWIEIPAGKFTTSPENVGRIEISLFEYDGGNWKRGLVIKGVVIRAKN